MKFLTRKKLGGMKDKKFAKLYLKKLEKLCSKDLDEIKEKNYSKEDFLSTMLKINLDLLKNKIKKLMISWKMKNEKIGKNIIHNLKN